MKTTELEDLFDRRLDRASTADGQAATPSSSRHPARFIFIQPVVGMMTMTTILSESLVVSAKKRTNGINGPFFGLCVSVECCISIWSLL
jgi:hypothetical protein